MSRIRCFFLENTGLMRFSLRRYTPSSESKCVGGTGYHNSASFFCDAREIEAPVMPDKADSRWPKKCDACEYIFKDGDERQVISEGLYKTESGVQMVLRNAPVGAIWYSDNFPVNEIDGHYLMVKTPGGVWHVDGRASNCAKPQDKLHKCWIRHGTVPDITVDKIGNTCASGAGSIAIGNYHGFLRNGWLEE